MRRNQVITLNGFSYSYNTFKEPIIKKFVKFIYYYRLPVLISSILRNEDVLIYMVSL